MKVILRQPRREIQVDGVTTVAQLLKKLDLVAESVLVIRGDELLTTDARLSDDDVVELRPVISGGATV
ncbi:MAG: thiamine biosynthesis protein ThiS [Acidimicrobiia bacterium]|nr:MAG: thiamine biosynthesis protein ThiS [Acidimicrobiia bacterium]